MKITTKLIITESNKNDFEKLKECSDIVISAGVEVKFPVLTTSGYIELRENAKAEFPVLTTSGNIDLSENAKAEFPVLTTSGYIELRENAKLIHPKTKNLNYKAVDNTMFVIESEKTSKGIKILSGYVLKEFKNKSLVKEVCYVAEKDNFFAHGENLKKAITDLQFKLVSEKLKKEPIKKDTIITVQYYRLITGACEMGVKSWMQSNGIKKESYKASELLPLLEKTNAYGLERFKQLITF